MLKKSLGLASIGLMAIALYLIFFYASTEKTMGIVQKIFYFHVPNALLSYGSAIVLGLASIMYLIKADRAWDRFGSVAGELGCVFTSTAIVSGMITFIGKRCSNTQMNCQRVRKQQQKSRRSGKDQLH